MKRVELLAPAGDLEKLKMAIIYGADAVYIGGEKFGLRAASKNFTKSEMIEGINFAHEHEKRVYVTCNIIPHNEDLDGASEYFKYLESIGVDAIIISDPGFLLIAKESVPNMELHLSTQANTTNFSSAKFWHSQGIKRIVTARELSLDELKDFKNNIPSTLELEAFVHGAMCISYSGRCLISNYFTSRDANRGECAQPCRWNYALMEEKRPGQFYPVEQDDRGTYFFNSKDLCLIEYIPELIKSGIDSLKIEGRIKTSYYVATVVRAYRMAIDAYYEDPENWKFNEAWMDELMKVSYRDFTTAFFESDDTSESQNYGSSSYIRNFDFVGLVKSGTNQEGYALIEQRNKFSKGEIVEIIGPDSNSVLLSQILEIKDIKNITLESSNVPKQEVYVKLEANVKENYILRRAVEKND